MHTQTPWCFQNRVPLTKHNACSRWALFSQLFTRTALAVLAALSCGEQQGGPNQQHPINFVMLPWKIQCTASTVETPMRGKRGKGNDYSHILQWRVSEGEKAQNSSGFSKFTGSCEYQQNQLTPLEQVKDTFSGTGSWRSPCYAAGWISRRAQHWTQPSVLCSSTNSTKVEGRAYLRFRHVSKNTHFTTLGNNVIIAKHNCLKLSYMCYEISHTIGHWGIALTSLIQLCKVRNVSKS